MSEVKNIRITLYDGTLEGLVKCTLYMWHGVLYKFSREQVLNKSLDNRPEFNHNGIYFLLGYTESGEPKIYVGQASTRKSGGGLLSRIQEHTKSADKDFFTEVVILTTVGDDFGPTELNYLENACMLRAKEVNQYIVHNGNEPSMGNIDKDQELSLMPFVDNAAILLRTLGHPALMKVAGVKQIQTLPESNEGIEFGNDVDFVDKSPYVHELEGKLLTADESNRLALIEEYYKTLLSTMPSGGLSTPFKGDGAIGNLITVYDEPASLWYIDRRSNRDGYRMQAVCVKVGDTYTVLKGSRISMSVTSSLDQSIRQRIKDYINDGRLQGDGLLLDNITFKYPSAASNFVIGTNTNGLQQWHTRDGQSMKDFLNLTEAENEQTIGDVEGLKSHKQDTNSYSKAVATSDDEQHLIENGQAPVSNITFTEESHLPKSLEELEGLELSIYYSNFKKSGKDIQARCRIENGQYVVLKGSVLRAGEAKAFEISKPRECEFRRSLEARGIIRNHILQEDIAFKSPSTAAVLVMGTSMNGFDHWKTEDGRLLKEIVDRTKNRE